MSETELTQDEYTVLLIASSGEYMMPIGRWEAPVEALVQRGLLHRHDKFNNTITEKGKEAIKLRDAQDSHAILTAFNKAAIESRSGGAGSAALPQIYTEIYSNETLLDTAAKALFSFANSVSNSKDRELGLRRASEEVLKRALEFL